MVVFCGTLCFMLDTVCPAFFSVGEFRPLFSSDQNEHLILVAVVATITTLSKCQHNGWKIKGSK